jgi:hypothetical protein
VRAALEPLRELADEILIAVDSRAGSSELGEYAAVADRVIRFEVGPTHSALTWLHAQCRCDWISIAGDEIPSEALVAALPELVRSRGASATGSSSGCCSRTCAGSARRAGST